MKAIISIILSLTLLLCGANAEIMEFAMLKTLYTAGENTVFSPVSLNAALNMAAEGASGTTKDEILAFVNDLATDEISSANAVFVAPGVELRPSYQIILASDYAAEAFPIDDQVVETANQWISEKTNGMIENFMQQPPKADTGLILLNAVAMEKDWLHPFKAENTSEEDFFTAETTVPVQMMRQTEDFLYAERDGTQIVCLPYQESALEMWIAMPEAGRMDDLLQNLGKSGVDYFLNEAAMREVILSLPKVDTSDDNDLADHLKSLGVNTAFTADADFSGISDTPMCIGSVRQKARIQMDEKSTSAAAVTQVAMLTMAAAPGSRPEPVVMTVNRPYFFAVWDSWTGAICFCGVIENPVL